jgi:ATP-dependent metalloprotease
VNTAALHAATKDKTVVGMADLEYAKDKILMGPERKSAVFPLKSRTLAAYHEGGHTLMAMFTEGAPQLHKATIMPRGASLGHTAFVLQRDEDMYSRTKLQMLADLDCAMGGRVAEELVFGFEEVTTGAGSDLANATSIARNMVLRVGMGPRTGPRSLVEDDLETLSAETKHKVDQDIRELLQDSYERATKKLTSKRVELERLAQALLTYETLDQREIFSVVNGKPLQRAEL